MNDRGIFAVLKLYGVESVEFDTNVLDATTYGSVTKTYVRLRDSYQVTHYGGHVEKYLANNPGHFLSLYMEAHR